MKKKILILAASLSLLLTGCILTNPLQVNTLPPGLATGTAQVGSKLTQAAELTAYPMTPLPTDQTPYPSMAWTPGPYEISAQDSGKTFDIWITSRISLILDRAAYPEADLTETCDSSQVIGRVSNIPVVPPQYYVIRYEGVQLGQCLIRNGAFQVTIRVVIHP